MISFENISPSSRIWIYQSLTALNPDIAEGIKKRARLFLAEWTSHGHQMDAALEIFHERFVVLAVDEKSASASGCGIDKSVRFIQEIEKEFGISLLDRMHAAWEENGSVKTARLAEFQSLLDSNQLTKNTLVFNNLIETKGQLQTSWRIPLSDSWHARFIKA